MVGQVEVSAGHVNFRASLPRSENNVLQPMLHPAHSGDCALFYHLNVIRNLYTTQSNHLNVISYLAGINLKGGLGAFAPRECD